MNKDIGKQGENIATDYLEKEKYQILNRNYHKRQGEIDIIAFDPNFNETVFVEVKTRTSRSFGYPEESVNKRKLQKLVKTAQIWLEENEKADDPWRIDVIAIELIKNSPEIKHLKNVTQDYPL